VLPSASAATKHIVVFPELEEAEQVKGVPGQGLVVEAERDTIVPKPMQSAVENDQCVPDQFDARDMLEFAWPLSTSAQDEAERAVRREDAHVPSLGITHYGLRCGSDRHLRGPFEQLLGIVSGADGARVG